MSGATSPTRRFLMQHPRPARVRLHVPGEQPRVLDVGPGVSWVKFANTVDALTPTVIEALDAAGTLLRARNTELEPEPEPEPEGEVLEDESSDSPDGTLRMFARLLAEAYRNSNERIDVAFNRLVDIVNAMNKRQESQERLINGLERIVRRQAEDAAGLADAAAAGGGEGTLMQQMLAAYMQGQTARVATNGAANGAASAAHPKGDE